MSKTVVEPIHEPETDFMEELKKICLRFDKRVRELEESKNKGL